MKASVFILAIFLMSCGGSGIKIYPIYNAPDGIVTDTRNGQMYCVNDSGMYVVRYTQHFNGFGDAGYYKFSWMYRVGDSFSSVGYQDTLRSWQQKGGRL